MFESVKVFNIFQKNVNKDTKITLDKLYTNLKSYWSTKLNQVYQENGISDKNFILLNYNEISQIDIDYYVKMIYRLKAICDDILKYSYDITQINISNFYKNNKLDISSIAKVEAINKIIGSCHTNCGGYQKSANIVKNSILILLPTTNRNNFNFDAAYANIIVSAKKQSNWSNCKNESDFNYCKKVYEGKNFINDFNSLCLNIVTNSLNNYIENQKGENFILSQNTYKNNLNTLCNKYKNDVLKSYKKDITLITLINFLLPIYLFIINLGFFIVERIDKIKKPDNFYNNSFLVLTISFFICLVNGLYLHINKYWLNNNGSNNDKRPRHLATLYYKQKAWYIVSTIFFYAIIIYAGFMLGGYFFVSMLAICTYWVISTAFRQNHNKPGLTITFMLLLAALITTHYFIFNIYNLSILIFYVLAFIAFVFTCILTLRNDIGEDNDFVRILTYLLLLAAIVFLVFLIVNISTRTELYNDLTGKMIKGGLK